MQRRSSGARAAAGALCLSVVFAMAACGTKDRSPFDPSAEVDASAAPAPPPPGFFPDPAEAGPASACVNGDCEKACADAAASKGARGCDFYVPLPRTWVGLAANRFETSCFVAMVTNTFERPVQITLEHHGQTVDGKDYARIPSGSGRTLKYDPLPFGLLPAGQVALVFLSGTPHAAVPCPGGVVPLAHDTEPTCGNCLAGKDEAFHVKTSAPVAVADIFPYGGGASAVTGATSLLPTASWGTQYITVDAYDGNGGAYPWTMIVAKEDGTVVRVTPRPTNTVQSFALRKGQVLLLQLQSDQSSLTGSAIVADRPVGAFVGHDCTYIPNNVKACDGLHQTLPPIDAVGNAYGVVRPRDRYAGTVESAPVRLVGLVDGTTLTYAPYQPTGAPTALARGQAIEFRADRPFFVSSQDKAHPFYALLYMTGCEEYGPTTDCRGDPEVLSVVSPEEFETRSSFFTDPTYPETHLVVTRAKKGGVFSPVTLDCAGELTDWRDLGGDLEYTRVDLVTGNFEKRGNCDNGRHDMTSTGPFNVAVWGWGSAATLSSTDPNDVGLYTEYVSYAYSAGAAARSINSVPAVPPR